ncbi:MAG: SLBB domain-containing protein [Verrucomicrobia bacterium]|nr:SLBB domain-containing protein [Verrucomicrobiota bacterium]
MKHVLLISLVAVLALAAGCQSKNYGPRFDPRAPTGPAGTNASGLSFAPALRTGSNAASLSDAAFTVVTTSNRLEAEWLKPSTNLFRIGPGDLLEIEVLGDSTSKATAVVGPDGRIYYSLLPGTSVWGLTLTEAKQTLEKGLKRYLRVPPDISITLRSVGSRTVWILGNVNSPGVYSLSAPLTLLEAISGAGGTMGVAGAADGICDLQRSFVMRHGKLLPVDFDQLIRQGDLSQNIYLQPDDFVYLRSALTRSVYVLGAVGAPAVLPFADDMTLLSAVLSVGGTVPYARVSQVAIIRGSLADPRFAEVDFKEIMQGQAQDIRLQAGDIVYVPFSPWRKLGLIAESMLDQFVRTMAVNEGSRAVSPNAGPVRPVVPFGNLQTQ